jgi:hypothetical protein
MACKYEVSFNAENFHNAQSVTAKEEEEEE